MRSGVEVFYNEVVIHASTCKLLVLQVMQPCSDSSLWTHNCYTTKSTTVTSNLFPSQPSGFPCKEHLLLTSRGYMSTVDSTPMTYDRDTLLRGYVGGQGVMGFKEREKKVRQEPESML